MDESTMIEVVSMQKRTSSPLFWIGLVSCVYEAVINSLVASGVVLPSWVNAVGVALAAVLIYCNGNNPSLTKY